MGSRESVEMPDEWYREGLRFTCTQCGNCCTGESGYVWFNDEELEAMARYTELTPERFVKRHAHKIEGKWSLNERRGPDGFDCVFLQRDDAGKALCMIYPVRPMQCRTWPFWPENLDTPEDYVRAGKTCPGLQKGLQGEGEFVPIEQIRIRRDATES